MRTIDWSTTSLGPVEGWPWSLRSALSICLGSSFPIAIYWGKDLILLYNDAWSPIPGTKHPWALGRAAQEVWPEIWPTIGPLFEQVQQAGEATRSQDELLPMRRHGYTEECYFDYTFTAIRGEDGRVGGIFNAVIETTFRVIHARRTTLLAQLSKHINQVRSREEVWPVAIDSLATDPKDIPFCLLYTIDPASPAWAVLTASTGIATPFTRVPLGEANPASGKDLLLPGWPTDELLAGKGTYQVIDLTTLPEPLPQGPWPEPCQQAIVFPLFVIAGNPTGFMVAGISSRRKLDADYIQFYESVAQQLGTALTNVHALEQERKKAEALSEIDKAKTVFFSNISHEFRTPLTLMLAPLAELLASPSLVPKHRDTLQLVHRNSLRLLRLVNTLLDFSRLEAGRVRAFFKPVDLSGLTEELSSMFRSTIEQAGLAFEVNCAPVCDPVYVDESLWERILFNLLSNAFKFTLQGTIKVTLAQVGQQVVLRVQDTGTGIPPEELPKLFSRFHRVEHAVGRTHEGSGIGLAMVYELVKLHGGTVSVESTPGESSTFTVSLPVGKDHLPPTQVVSRETPGRRTLNALPDLEEELGLFNPLPSPEEALIDREIPDQAVPAGLTKEQLAVGSGDAFIQTSLIPEGKPLVLVADDNPDMRQFLVRLLEAHYRVRAVRDGNEALQAVGQTLPDLILSDVMMPHLDGLGLLKALRADRRTAALPVLLLSARAGEESTIAGMEAGADDYLIKPFSAPELLSRVQAQLKLAALRQALHQKDQLLLNEVDRQQQRLEALLMEAPAPIVILDGPELIFQLVNPAYQRIFPGRQLVGKPLLEALPEVATTPIPTILGQVYQSGETYVAREVPLMLARKEGEPVEEIYWTFTYQARRNTGGQVDGVLVFAYEVTDQVRARQAIEESQKQFKILSEAIPQLVWTATPAGAITYCNPQWYAYTGLSEEQSLGQGWTSAFHPEDLPHLLERWQQALRTGQSYQTEARLKSGQGAYRWFLLRALPLPDEQGSIKQWFGTDTDIHDRKLAEETLRESEAQFRLMADAVPQIVWLTDPEGRVEFFNKQWTRYTGAAYEPTTAAQVAASFVHPQDGQLTMEAFAQARQKGIIFSVEHRIRSAEGNYRWFLVRAEPYRDPNTGEILRWFGASIDIHDQKLAQQALQESEERFRIMADAAPNIVWALHPDGTQKYLNKFGLQYLGVTLQEALALNWTPFIHAEDLAATSRAVSGAIEHQRPYRQEHRLRRHDGEYRWYLAREFPVIILPGSYTAT